MSATAALLLLSACAPNAGSTGVSAPVVSREWVTDATAAALGPDGRFVLLSPPHAAPSPLQKPKPGRPTVLPTLARVVHSGQLLAFIDED